MMLPSPQRKKIGTLEKPISQLNTQLMVPPVNASRQPSRAAAHRSGARAAGEALLRGRLSPPILCQLFLALSIRGEDYAGPFMELIEVTTHEDSGILTAWCWWSIPGTAFQGAGLIKVGDDGVRWERLAFYTKLPE